MVKLQKRNREGAADMYSINIPIDVIDNLKWKKGEEISVSVQKVKKHKALLCIKTEDLLKVTGFGDG